ncbi:MAG: lipoate--protein ligase family protein, partial [Gemmatimonadota bacterium]
MRAQIERREPPGPVTTAIRWIVDPPARGAWNMAADVALARSAEARGCAAVRLSGWAPPCLSFGRHQPTAGRYDATRLRARGIDVVRRPTGGGAVWHEDEVTYAVAVPAHAWGGPRVTCRLVHAAILEGLRALGVPGRAASCPAPIPPGRACFASPAEGEIVIADRKLVGSAQARIGGALLQHGSILISGGQALAESDVDASTAAPATLASALGVRPAREDVRGALATGFRAVLGVDLAPDTLDEGE